MKSLEEHAGYREAWQRQQELQGELAEVRRQISAATVELGQLPDGARRLRSEAAALTSGGGTAVADRQADDIRGDVDELRHKEKVLAEALTMQKQIVEAERVKASKKMCLARAPKFLARNHKIRVLLGELIPLVEEDHDEREDLARQGCLLQEPICNEIGPTNYPSTLWRLQTWHAELVKRGI